MRRRVWSEFLPPEELGSGPTLRLLERYGLEPIVALPPEHETGPTAAALARLSSAGIRTGIWPLLSDEDGYWPSEENATAFAARVESALGFVETSGARVFTVAIDLEPPLAVTRKLMNGTWREKGRLLYEGARELTERRAVRARSVEILAGVNRRLVSAGFETIAACIPPVVLDLFARTELLQQVFRTPVRAPGWDVISVMMYTTAIRPLLPSGSMSSARALLYESARMLAESDVRASLSLGLVASGKLGDEPAYTSPGDLRQDVAVARAAGIDDLALFCLEGVLSRGSPEAWLEPYTAEPPAPPLRLFTAPLGALMRTASLGAMVGHAFLR